MARIILFTLSFLFISQFIKTYAQPTYINYYCKDISKGTPATLLERNRLLQEFFETNVSPYASTVKFYNVTTADIPNKAYVLFQCREDISQYDCKACVQVLARKILLGCPFHNEAMFWYVECVFRFAYRNIFSSNETSPFYWVNNTSVSKVPELAPIVAKTMNGLINLTAMGTRGSHFGKTETDLTSFEKLYSFAMCTPDLDTFQCNNCLQTALDRMNYCCTSRTRAMIVSPSCQLGYDNQPLFVGEKSNASSPSVSPHDHEASPTSSTRRTKVFTKHALKPVTVIAIPFAAAVGLALLVAGFWLCVYRKEPEESFEDVPDKIKGLRDDLTCVMDDIESLQFDFMSVKASTCNFSWENKLGEGGFGEVYKGKLSNGENIAVKRLSRNSQYGAFQFKNEVLLLAKLQHKNLVKLYGFSTAGDEKLLIYEFMSNSSLDRFLYDSTKRASLQWPVRFKILVGVARGLLYLHEDSRLKIIHRDLKASNILLDEAMNAKIADFGIAKIFESDQTRDETMRIAGTYGYMAPEYALAGQFSVKSDVYSFGVILLETISGQRNRFFHREEGLIHRAWRLWKEEAIMELADPLLDFKSYKEEVKLCIQIGLLCIQEDSTHRPRMASVLAALNGQSVTLPLPNAPHFFTIADTTDATSSNDDLKRNSDASNLQHSGTRNITEIHPR